MQLLRNIGLLFVLLPIFILLDIFVLLQMTLSLLFGTGTRGWKIAVAKDQLGNVSAGGHEDETFSSRCWRMRGVTKYDVMREFIDWVFLVFAKEEDHCKNSYLKEMTHCGNRFP